MDSNAVREMYEFITARHDECLDGYLHDVLVRDRNNPLYGQYVDRNMLDEFSESAFASYVVSSYCTPISKYYHSDEALNHICDICDAALKKMNADGTTNMLTTNLHTADQFALVGIADAVHDMLGCLSGREHEAVALKKLKAVVAGLANGCMHSGFHTPNHRWIEAEALISATAVMGDEADPRWMKKAEAYLAEGIDCDEYGEWSERSAGMYNHHCDMAFLTMYRYTGRREYLDAACRNLDLMLYYINDDMSMFSLNSRRKDKGETGACSMFSKAMTYYADYYCGDYLEAAYYTGNQIYLNTAVEIFRWCMKSGRFPQLRSHLFLGCPDILDMKPDGVTLRPREYELYQPKSRIVRKKCGGISYTVMGMSPYFLVIDAHEVHLRARMCSSFFAVAQFVSDEMTYENGRYILKMRAHGEYKLPLENPDESCRNYWSIDYSARKPACQLDLYMTAEIKLNDDGVDLKIKVDGYDHVPFKLEIFTNAGMICECGDATMYTKAGSHIFSRGSDVTLRGPDMTVVTVGGLTCEHLYAENMRGSYDLPSDCFTVFSTAFSPVDADVTIKIGRQDGAYIYPRKNYYQR